MCLILFSPTGKLPDYGTVNYANQSNPDGIGIMSRFGIRKYLGKRQCKRAYFHMRQLSEKGVPFCVHFRWATHGAVEYANVHPFVTNKGAFVMHNGVLSGFGSKDVNDTQDFIATCLHSVESFVGLEDLLAEAIGSGNKLVIYEPEADRFTVANERAGIWHGGFWYSNGYSLPNALLEQIDQDNGTHYATGYGRYMSYELGYGGYGTMSTADEKRGQVFDSATAAKDYYASGKTAAERLQQRADYYDSADMCRVLYPKKADGTLSTAMQDDPPESRECLIEREGELFYRNADGTEEYVGPSFDLDDEPPGEICEQCPCAGECADRGECRLFADTRDAVAAHLEERKTRATVKKLTDARKATASVQEGSNGVIYLPSSAKGTV